MTSEKVHASYLCKCSCNAGCGCECHRDARLAMRTISQAMALAKTIVESIGSLNDASRRPYEDTLLEMARKYLKETK